MNHTKVLFIIVTCMFFGITMFESAKQIFFPNISLWQSHFITILFSCIISLLIGFFALRSYRKLLVMRENAEAMLRQAHDELEVRVAERTGELSESMKEADLANRAKSELMANISHELRTPLNAIIGFSSIMKAQMFGPIEAKYLDYADDINRSGEHLLNLINDILDVSVIEAGRLELDEEDLIVRTIVEATFQMVKVRSSESNIRLTMEVAPDLPPLFADKRRVMQILLNLLSNAIKFTPPRGTVSLNASLDGDGAHVISVSDTGIGMDRLGVEIALSKFGQLDSGLNRKQQGSGLGLPLSVGLIQLHGGTLHIKSEVGIGTVATVRFPTHRTRENQNAAE